MFHVQSVLQQTALLPGAAPASATFTWTSVGTRSVHNSMFTACVHDVHRCVTPRRHCD
jgi:hypothetical protein